MGGDMSFENGPKHEAPETVGDVCGDVRMPRPEDCIPYDLWHSKPDERTTADLDRLERAICEAKRDFETVGDTLGDTVMPAYDRPLLDASIPLFFSLVSEPMTLANSDALAPLPEVVGKAMAVIGSDPTLRSLVSHNLDGFIGTDTVKRDEKGVYPCSIDITGPVERRSYKCVLHLPIVEKSEPAQIASAICLFAKYAEFGRQGRSDWGSLDIRIAALEVQQDVLSRFGGESKWVRHQLEELGPKLARYREELALVA